MVMILVLMVCLLNVVGLGDFVGNNSGFFRGSASNEGVGSSNTRGGKPASSDRLSPKDSSQGSSNGSARGGLSKGRVGNVSNPTSGVGKNARPVNSGGVKNRGSFSGVNSGGVAGVGGVNRIANSGRGKTSGISENRSGIRGVSPKGLRDGFTKGGKSSPRSFVKSPSGFSSKGGSKNSFGSVGKNSPSVATKNSPKESVKNFGENVLSFTRREGKFSANTGFSPAGSGGSDSPQVSPRNVFFFKFVVLLLVFAVVFAIGFYGYRQYLVYQSKKEVRVATTSSVSSVKIPDCDIADLGLNVFLNENQVPVGAGSSFGVSVTNKSTKTCLAKAGSDKFGVRVVSGDHKIWDSVSCPVTSKDNPLLLKAGQTWTGSLQWDGGIYGADCSKVGVAGAGTYRLLGVKNGDLLDSAHVFVVK